MDYLQSLTLADLLQRPVIQETLQRQAQPLGSNSAVYSQIDIS